MDQNPDISVIIPVFNCEDVLRESLDSLVRQTKQNIEIICIDDGSTDSSGKILDEYEKADDRIKIIRQPNSGAGAARNAGLQVAKGKYLSFLDADDIFKNNMLERAYDKALKDDLDIIVFRSDEFLPAQNRYRSCHWSINEALLPDNSPFAGTDITQDTFKLFVGWAWDKLFKASFIRENGLRFQEIRTTNDMLFVFSAIVKAIRIGYMHDVLVHHRKDQGSLSVTREKSWGCFREALLALRQQLIDWQLYERFEQDYINYCVHASLWNVRTLAEPTKSMLKAKLKESWADEFGIKSQSADYFFNQGEYAEFAAIVET